MENPYIITSPSEYYEKGISLFIANSPDILEITNFLLASLHLKNCENVTIKNVALKKLELVNCSEILIQDATIIQKVRIIDCKRIVIQETSMKKYHVDTSEEISVLNCQIKKNR